MDLIKITQLLSASNLREYRDDDYWVDRLSHRYSIVIFSVFAVLVTTKAYIGDPIDCWAPPEFKASYERYAETLCFVNGTYYISSTEIDIPIDPTHRYSNRIRYYQWTPFILLLQALTMYAPRILWLSLNTKYGINLSNLVDAAKKYESVDSFINKEKILVYICKNLIRTIQLNTSYNKKIKKCQEKRELYLAHKYEIDRMMFQLNENKLRERSRSPSSSASRSESKQSPETNRLINSLITEPPKQLKKIDFFKTYLSSLYLIIKIFYLLVAVGQLFFLNRLIGNNFYLIGLTLLKSFFNEIQWPHLDVFPRMTLCEIYIREVGTVHQYLIQCVLRINLFNEVIFVLVWYWLVFCVLMTFSDLILKITSFMLFSSYHRKMFALKYLELIHLNSKYNKESIDDLNTNKETEMFEKFCDLYFSNDTMFALRVIEQNASSFIVSEIIENLWLKFKLINNFCDYDNDDDDDCLMVDKKVKKRKKYKNRKISESSGSEFTNHHHNNNNSTSQAKNKRKKLKHRSSKTMNI
ncbi:unnamed protein product [Brachionus calyciflorus]|uniref:Innexin n=1 Tax=Brachionus calyciflorus TaxID=104777 RepID=A0A814F0B4_9BILA|nr:unnamed protein product [Brachionus calyciflorus]